MLLAQLLINGLIYGLIVGVVGLGYSLYYNVTKIFHIAIASLFALSLYFFYTFYTLWHINVFLAGLMTMIATSIVGLMVEVLVYQPILRRKGSLTSLLIASLGVMIILTNIVPLIWGNEDKDITGGRDAAINIKGIILTYSQISQLIIGVIVILIILLFLNKTRLGVVFRSIKTNEDLAKHLGINILKYHIVSMILSSVITAIAAILIAIDEGFNPYKGMSIFLSGIVAFIIGGIERFETPVIGGILIGVLKSLIIWKFSTRWQDAIVFVILIILLIFKPYGIMGKRRREV